MTHCPGRSRPKAVWAMAETYATIAFGFARHGGFNTDYGRPPTSRKSRACRKRATTHRDSFPRAKASQFPALFRRPDYFAGGHVDANGRRSLAGLSIDGIVGAVGSVGLRKPDSDLSVRAAGRTGGGPLVAAAPGNRDANLFDAAGVYASCADTDPSHSRVGNHRSRDAIGNGERVRRSGAAIVLDRDGGPRGF